MSTSWATVARRNRPAISSDRSVGTQATTASTTSKSTQEGPRKIFMDISSAASAEELKEMLERHYGQVRFVDIHTNKYGRTMAFIGFRYHSDASTALQDLNGYPLDGMVFHPQWAIPREKETKKPKQSRKGKSNGSTKKKVSKR